MAMSKCDNCSNENSSVVSWATTLAVRRDWPCRRRCYPPAFHSVVFFDRFAESMASFSAALETEDDRLRSRALEHYGSFLYLVGDMDASLEHLRWVLTIWLCRNILSNW